MKLENGLSNVYYLQHLLSIPRKILSRSDLDNITEFVLDELCHNDCFHLQKAAYFVDNPDFNCFRGVAGVDRSEATSRKYCIWDDAQKFSAEMRDSTFNQKVKQISLHSPRHTKQSESEFVQKLASSLLLNNCHFYSWDMRHGNHGIFLYEPDRAHQKEERELLEQVACILGFCPLF